MVLCCDGREGPSAGAGSHAARAADEEGSRGCPHEYERNGTTTLFAALNVLDDQVFGQASSAAHAEWLQFLRHIDRQTPKGNALHLIADSCATTSNRQSMGRSKRRKKRVPARREVIAMHCVKATRAGKGAGSGAQAAAATTFSCALSNLKRGGSFTVLRTPRDPKPAATRCAATTALAVAQQCSWWALFAAMTLANVGPLQ